MKVFRLTEHLKRRIIRSAWVNICVTHFLFRIVSNKEMLFYH